MHVDGDTFTYAQLADMVEQDLSQPVQRVLWNMNTLRKALAAHPQDGMRKYHLAFARNTGIAWVKNSIFELAQQVCGN